MGVHMGWIEVWVIREWVWLWLWLSRELRRKMAGGLYHARHLAIGWRGWSLQRRSVVFGVIERRSRLDQHRTINK